MKKITAFFIFSFLFTASLTAQPQYYNANSGGIGNSLPFGSLAASGFMTQWLIGPGEYGLPTPAPAGNITKLYIWISASGSGTYTQLTIKMGQTALTTFPTGVIYSGQLDTVYYNASAALTATANTWMVITLTRPFTYNPAQSLVIQVSHCGITGTGFSVYQTAGTTGIMRRNNITGTTSCVFTYSSQDTRIIQNGIDIAAPPTSCNLYSTAWCPAGTFANLPAGTFYEAAAWLGDTLYCQTPDASGVASATIIRYTWRGTWSTGVPLPVVKEGGTLTACGNKLYYIGGSSSVATGSTDTYEYNPATGTWTLKAPMPAALSGHGTVNWGDSVLFVVSGNWAAPSTGVYAYRPASNTWITTSPCPFGRRSHATGISGNKIFMAAGYNAGYKKELAIGTIGGDASTISWVTGPSIPVSYNGISRTGGTAYGDKFYVVAGEREVGLQSDETWVWNIAGGTWTMISGKPVAVSNNFAGVTSKCINDTLRVFCVGGMNASSVGVNNLDVISCGPAVVGIGTINSGMPLTYNLSQNYPNPFNPVTRIAYTMPKSGNVKLIVYDILGKEVATLVNEFKATGTYSVDFDGSNLASGVYLYRIESGDFTAVKKMLLIK